MLMQCYVQNGVETVGKQRQKERARVQGFIKYNYTTRTGTH